MDVAHVHETFQESLSKSLGLVVLSEIGDKTFFIAALLAMRYGRSRVFAGSWGALALMTILSTAMGWAAPQLIPDYIVHRGAIALFFMFGIRMSFQALFWKEPEVSELDEVEAELEEHNLVGGEAADGVDTAEVIKGNASLNGTGSMKQRGSAAKEAAPVNGDKKAAKEEKPGFLKSCLCLVLPAIVVEAFLMTFLAEWGDRSQLATIGLAMAGNAYGVCLGGVLGHAACTGVAVVGGKQLAKYINERVVLGAGALLFLIFGLTALVEEV